MGTQALKRHEEAEEKIRDLTLNLKFAEIQAAAAEREAAKLSKSWSSSSPTSPTGRRDMARSASSSSRPSTRWPDTKPDIQPDYFYHRISIRTFRRRIVFIP